MINCHIHTFRDEDVPRGFLPLGLCNILSSKIGFFVFKNVIPLFVPESKREAYERYMKFVQISKMGTQEAILNECARFYPQGTKFVVLPMDMAYMGAGDVPRPYLDQIMELGDIAKRNPNVIPFIHIDPRRPGYYDLFIEAVRIHNFKGVKLYPPLGIYPTDGRLNQIYKYCNNNNLPIIAHGSPYNPVHFKGSRKELERLLGPGVSTKGKSIEELCSIFTHPQNYYSVLYNYPNLNICIAHFGSEYWWDKFLNDPGNPESWLTIIKNMMRQFPNFYTDISFTMEKKEYWPYLKVMLQTEAQISNQILFGSDYYMVETETSERSFSIELRAFLGEELFNKIAVENPKRFLKI